MKLIVTAPACWATEEIARKQLWLYLASAKKFGIEPQLYGINYFRQYPGEVPMRLDCLIDFLKRVGGDYTHVLYTDGWDVLFADPLDVIINKYKAFGAPPCLTCGSCQCYNVWPRDKYNDYYDLSKKNRYPGNAMYIGEIPYLLDCFERMDKRSTHDISGPFVHGWTEGFFRPEIDFYCTLYQNLGDEDSDEFVDVVDGRLHNSEFNTFPSMIHVSGGYADPQSGRDYKMIPWAQKLGII